MSFDRSAFCEHILQEHNRLRQQHGAPPLTLNKELCEQAQLWADKLAVRRHLAYCELPGIGENITFFPVWIESGTVVEHWYSEHMKYEYGTPGWQAGTNYFTQLIGVGRSLVEAETPSQTDQQVVVAFYRPAGNNNRTGQFAANVHKPLNA